MNTKKTKWPLALGSPGGTMILLLICIVIVFVPAYIKLDPLGMNKLGIRIEEGTAEEVERLLSRGVNPEGSSMVFHENIDAREGEPTWLHHLSSASYAQDQGEKLQLLIDYGADVNRRVSMCDYTPDEHMGTAYDENRGCNDGCGMTALMIACQGGAYEAVEVLIKNGADVNARDYCGQTALVYLIQRSSDSSEEERVEIAKLLLDHGADRTVSGRYNGTALEEARKKDMQKLEQLLMEY